MIRNSENHGLPLGSLGEGLANVVLLKQPIACPHIQASRDPTTTVAGDLVVVHRRVIRLPCHWCTTPVPEAATKQPKLSSICLGTRHRLAREIERNMLLQEPMALWTNNMETRSMRRRKPLMVDNPTRDNLVKTIRICPPMCRATVSFPAKRMWVIVEMQAVLSRSCVSCHSTIMFKNPMISDISSSRIYIVIDMVDAKPVVNPTASCGVAHFRAEGVVHDLC